MEATERFVSRLARPAGSERVLATILFTDIVGSTELAARVGDSAWRELLQKHHAIVRRELARFQGRELDTAGDGFFASFDGPARAVQAASAIRDALLPLEIQIRSGLHTGECEVSDGIAVSIGARISSLAAPGEVLVSSTVKDLVAGSGLGFEATTCSRASRRIGVSSHFPPSASHNTLSKRHRKLDWSRPPSLCFRVAERVASTGDEGAVEDGGCVHRETIYR
jgi:class 3 adenylate cyclase